jgi:hypothetical protein
MSLTKFLNTLVMYRFSDELVKVRVFYFKVYCSKICLKELRKSTKRNLICLQVEIRNLELCGKRLGMITTVKH